MNDPDPGLFRWSPAQHYDAAVHALAEIPHFTTHDDDRTQTAVLLAIAHGILGVLRRLDQYTP